MNKHTYLRKQDCVRSQGFTLLELLVVIAIIAVIVAIAVTNFVGARQRARDIRKKAELQQIKSALRLYYNDYVVYPGPATTTTNTFNGCAAPPTSTPCSGSFAIGTTVYMKLLPPASDYVWSYRQVSSGDNFCLWTTLDVTTDAEITKSQTKCNLVCSGIAPAGSYVECAD
jgi:prepilin-type N-terminal cleavage/methylation domain-containing protein